ncbi:CPBP family intramembrane glutamic endopeptidase [Furfurilactobacillus entadae]|uniref:CPBP family intramembrane glutamic endopeptidase n=1 Tax=Furfurilactobacillus entadae TaxID=2922307 RepID=UPI0035E5030E
MKRQTGTQTVGFAIGLTLLMMVVLWSSRQLLGAVVPRNEWMMGAEAIVLLTLWLVNHYGLHEPLPLRPKANGQLWRAGWLGIIVIVSYIPMIPLMAITQHYAVSTVVETVLMCVMVGIYEEILFRGVILGMLLRTFTGKRRIMAAVLTSSALFGLSHAGHFFDHVGQSTTSTWLQIGYAFCLGVYFCAVTLRTGSLLWTMIIHAAFDMPAMLVEFSGHMSLRGSAAGGSFWTQLADAATEFVPVLLLGLWLIRRRQQAAIDEATPMWQSN